MSEICKLAHGREREMKAHGVVACAVMVLALAVLGACTPGAEDLAYPDLNRTPTVASPASLLTPDERDAAISELNAEGAANAEIVQ